MAVVFGCHRFDQYLAREDKIMTESDGKRFTRSLLTQHQPASKDAITTVAIQP